MAVRVEFGTEKRELTPEEVKCGQEWLSLLADQLDAKNRLGSVAIKADDVEECCVEPGVSVVFAPDDLVKRELILPRGRGAQESTFVISNDSMPVRKFTPYWDGEIGQARVALSGPYDKDGNYQVVRPLLGRLITHREVGVTGAFPIEQAA